MANETFRVVEYLGPKATKTLLTTAGESFIFESRDVLEGVPCMKTEDILEDITEDVVENVIEDDVLIEDVDDVRAGKVIGKTQVKRVVGKKTVQRVVGKRVVGQKVVGQHSVGRKVCQVTGEDNISFISRTIRDSTRIGENYYRFATDLEVVLQQDAMKDSIKVVVLDVLHDLGLLKGDDGDDEGDDKPKRGRPLKFRG